MANVISILETPTSSGDTFKHDADGKGSSRKFVVSVTTLDTLATLIDDVFAVLPQRGAVHPRCSSIYANDISVSMRGEDNRTYDATVGYKSRLVTTSLGTVIRSTKPWEEGASVSFQSWAGQERVIQQAYAKMTTGVFSALRDPLTGEWKGEIVTAGPLPIVNSAGDPYMNPPTAVDFGVAMVLTWAIQDSSFDFANFMRMSNTINGVDVNVGNRFTIPKWWGLISDLSATPREYFEDDPTTPPSSWPSELYWELSVTITINPASWNLALVDKGFRKKNGTKMEKIRDGFGELITEPAFLDGSGGVISLTDVVPPENQIAVGYMVKLPVRWDYLFEITNIRSFAVYKTKRT